MQIRPANLQDKETILSFVRELAVYEKKSLEDVNLTLEKIERDGFGPSPFFLTFIAEFNGQPVGYAFYYLAYSAWAGGPVLYVEDLFVKKNFRQQGIGLALLSELAKFAEAKQCCRMEGCVFDWNEKAITFYQSLGALLKKDLIGCRLSGAALIDLDNLYKKIET